MKNNVEKESEVPHRSDVIIIGSGIGGLISGVILSKKGYSVSILEKHFQIGGNLQTFKRKGIEFATGMHYFGCMDKGQILHKIFSYLGIIDKIELKRLDKNAFDLVCFDGEEYQYAQGFGHFQNTLVARFPEEKKAIETYVKKIQAIWNSNDLLNLRGLSRDSISKFGMFEEKVQDFFDNLTDNNKLKAVLIGTNGLYAGQADKAPIFVHSVILSSFIKSAWRLKSGGSHFADILKKEIENNGGQVLTRKEVIGFKYEGKKISAVLTRQGDTFLGDTVISNIHPANTVDLIEEKKIRKAFRDRIKSLENTISSFCVYIILKKRSFKFVNSNIFYAKKGDLWTGGDYDPADWPKGYMLYTTEDKENKGYAESLTVMTYMKFEEVIEWEHTTIGKRGQDYEHFKKQKAKELLDLVENKYPDVRSSIDIYYTSSPLTYRDYTGTVGGSMYGIVKDANDPIKTFISDTTRIPNLYLTGQNMLIHGMVGTTLSAILTCGNFMDINELIKEIRDIY